MATDIIARSMAAGSLKSANNLSDLASASSARANIGLGAPPYKSGRQYAFEGQGFISAGSTLTAGTIYFTPGCVSLPVTIQQLIARITTLGTGNVQMAIYAGDPVSGDPTGNPLFTPASQSTGATGLIGPSSLSVALAPNTLYWPCLMVDNTTVIFESLGATSLALSQCAGLDTSSTSFLNGSQIVGFTKTGTFGTWPTLTGNRATDGLSEVASKPAVFGFKVA